MKTANIIDRDTAKGLRIGFIVGLFLGLALACLMYGDTITAFLLLGFAFCAAGMVLEVERRKLESEG